MTDKLATRDTGAIAEAVLIGGDLSKLDSGQRANYYKQVCDSVGLNPFTKPFDYIVLNNKLTLYAKRDATDQLRKLHGVSCTITSRDRLEDIYIVTAKARDRDGREDESTGVVTLAGLKGDALANALMKAETKAKRRVTLSICGLGWMDESELDTTPAKRVNVNTDTGEILDRDAPPMDDAEAEFQSGLEEEAEVAEYEATREERATEKQCKLLHVLYGKKFPKTEDGAEGLHALKDSVTGDRNKKSADMTKTEARAMIDALNDLEDAA